MVKFYLFINILMCNYTEVTYLTDQNEFKNI